MILPPQLPKGHYVDGALLVCLSRHHRPGGFHRRASVGHSCFAVPPHGYGSDKAQRGLSAVWRYIRMHCMPL